MQVGDLYGFGRYGIVDENELGLRCHECGERYRYLGLHVWKAHQIRAKDYRTKYGLRRKGLVAQDLRQVMAQNAAQTMSQRSKFVERRNPEKAQAAFQEMKEKFSPAGKEAMRSARAGPRPKKFHSGTICEECSVSFCHLYSRRRRFCSQSCSNKHNRRQGRKVDPVAST